MMFVLFLTLNNGMSFVLTNLICDESTVLIEICRLSVFALSWEEKFGVISILSARSPNPLNGLVIRILNLYLYG